MQDEIVTAVGRLELPWGKEMEVQQVVYDSGLAMLRLRIREGRRFTVIDLDPDTAKRLETLLAGWAAPI